jgi:uncharacterized RDD family membrane protein YckC
VFSFGLAVISSGVHIVTGHSVSWNRSNIVVAVIFVGWQFLYFAYSWAASGRTFGMAVLGIRVIRADGSDLDPRRAVVRALVFPLSFLLFGLGFLGILVRRDHRALHDLIAGTVSSTPGMPGRPGSGSSPASPCLRPVPTRWLDVRVATIPRG